MAPGPAFEVVDNQIKLTMARGHAYALTKE